MPDPTGILQTLKRLAGEHGTVLVVDDRAEETFTVPASEMERFFYTRRGDTEAPDRSVLCASRTVSICVVVMGKFDRRFRDFAVAG